MEINWWTLVYFFILFAALFYAYVIWEAGYFKRRGIKNVPFDFPILGNMYKSLIGKEHFLDVTYRVYNAFPDEKYVGFMQVNSPLIMIRDLELLKQVTIKDFDYFMDHSFVIEEHVDPLFGNNLLSLKGNKWRNMRATLSPAFTSSKIRSMFKLIDEIGIDMVKFYLKKMNEFEWKERGLVEVEIKNTFTRYTNDVIASSAFGIKVNSLDDENNEFYKMGEKASINGIQFKKFAFLSAFPKFSKFFSLKFFPKTVRRFFRMLILDAMKNREQQNIVRPDMIQLLMQARKGSLKYEASQAERKDAGFATAEESDIGKATVKKMNWTDDEIVAQAVIFFIAGFDTASNLLTFIVYELTINPDIQKKLQDEIDGLILEMGNTLDYNDLMKLKYLDMVVTETLRLWPPAVATDRLCSRSYTLPPPNNSADKGYTIKPGEGIWVPIYAIHHDPQFYPNPEKFDPERFSDENKPNLNPLAFIPFGSGPRNCIGSRFALIETKTVLFHLLSNFDFVMTAKTESPIKLSYKTFNVHPANGIWIGLQPRNK